MKISIFIFAFLFSMSGYGQTVVPSSTTLATATGYIYANTYRFYYPSSLDTVDFIFDKNIPTKADTIAIQALKICPVCPPPVVCPICPPPIVCPPPVACPPPIVCPVCPVCPPPVKQRTCVGFFYDAVTGNYTFIYDDGTK